VHPTAHQALTGGRNIGEPQAADGHFVRELRHRFVRHIEKQVIGISGAKRPSELTELGRQFEEDVRDDYLSLKESLRLEAWQMIPTKEILVTVLAGIAAVAAVATCGVVPMPDVVSSTGACSSIGGLLASRSKYVTARRKVLKEHPVAYLYEAAGGPRL
jgi:hypothetical protein